MIKKIKLVIFLIFLLSLSMFSLYYQNPIFIDNENMKNIALILKMQNDDYWKSVRMGANVAAKEFNVKVDFTATDDENDINGQINLVNQAIERKVDALILAPIGYNELVQVTEEATNKKIPVLAIDSKVNTGEISSFIATDNFNAGKRAGEKLSDIAGKNSRIAIINFDKDTVNAKEREEGLMEVLSKYPEMKVVAKEYNLSDSKIASQLTRKIISNNGVIDAIIALNSISSIGVAQAIDEMGLAGRVKVIAFDSSPEEIELLEKGVIQATVTQNPFSMGYLGVKYAVLKLHGKKIPSYIDTGLAVVDKDDMYLPENQKILFPFLQ